MADHSPARAGGTVLLAERPVRVLVVVGPATGGIGAHAAALACDVAEQGTTVAVVCPALTAERFEWHVPVVRAWPGGPILERWQQWRRVRRLARTADVVHAHGHHAGLLSLLAVRGARPRPAVVVSWHNAVLGRGPRRWLRTLGELVQARGADLVTGASLDLAARAASLGAPAAELAPVAAPRAAGLVGGAVPAVGSSDGSERPTTAARAGARARLDVELDLDPRARIVLCIARIAPQKGLDLLVDAARALADDAEAVAAIAGPVTWLVVGDGDVELESRLREQVALAGVDVRFLGARDDVAGLLASADLLAVSSRWEARPLVVQEAMAAGVPVVATAVGGIPELLGGAGELVEPGAARGFARAVAALLSDPARHRRRVEQGRRRFAALPDRGAVATGWRDRYARLAPSSRTLR